MQNNATQINTNSPANIQHNLVHAITKATVNHIISFFKNSMGPAIPGTAAFTGGLQAGKLIQPDQFVPTFAKIYGGIAGLSIIANALEVTKANEVIAEGIASLVENATSPTKLKNASVYIGNKVISGLTRLFAAASENNSQVTEEDILEVVTVEMQASSNLTNLNNAPFNPSVTINIAEEGISTKQNAGARPQLKDSNSDFQISRF
jgi:hypothetical protein